ncbi:MAG: hypothetical protein ABJC04_04085 [Verrucomicrobiota bacterium]
MNHALDILLPHRAPMQWIDALIECDETTAVARVRFHEKHFAVSEGRVCETALVECIAQTVAAAMGERARRKKSLNITSSGMLTGVSNFKIEKPPPLHRELRIEIRESNRLGPMLRIVGKISDDGQIIASGELTLYA